MKKQIIVPITVIVFLVVLVIGWWLASPLFINKIVDEKLPQPINTTNRTNTETTNDQNLNVEYQGDFVDADSFHKTSGTAKIINIERKRYLSFENFETTNGPDLFVYLSTDKSSDDFVNLGRLKGNIGNQNYEIPDDVDLEKYDNAVIWCRAFSVLFGSAELS